ncbi:MAG: hypothetical protein QM780_05060 [Hyphomicrobium sp.]|uniref:hypothetical protein n=1 Tax=Hyphomicrobium sp. TaxID=82 RepID=UPI0039E350B4
MSEPLLIHVHVPKCAGTTVERHLRSELGRNGTWFAPKRTRKFPLGWFGRKYDATPKASLDEIKALSGHFIGQSIEGLFKDRCIVRSIILREPESLMLSYYNYRMMRYIGLGQRPYGFSLFLRATRENFISHFLLERWLELPWVDLVRLTDAQKAERLNAAMASMHHIAPIAETDALVEKISEEIGIGPAAERRNTTEDRLSKTGWTMVRLGDLSDEDRGELRSRTQLDRYLWRRWVLKENVPFGEEARGRFKRTEFARPRYQCERRLARLFG